MKDISNTIPSLAECLTYAGGTKYMVVKEGAFAELPQVLGSYFCENNSKKCFTACFSDKNTYTAAGKAVQEILQTAGIPVAESYIFEDDIHAEYKHVEKIKAILKTVQEKAEYGTQAILVPVAVGSGTINDLVKRAADELSLPYLCIPTAASVDGYTAYGAALLNEGFKQTMSCRAPIAVIADSTVLSEAPAYLSSSGFGDLAGKIIAGTDWIIADHVFELDGKGELAPGTAPIENIAWSMVQNPLKNNLVSSVNAVKGDKDAVKILFEALGITGFALQYMKDSRSVSGCEHMWSHVWEMEELCMDGIPVTHGHKVTIGTLAGAAFTECLFKEKPPLNKTVPNWAEREAVVRNTFAALPQILPLVLKTTQDKFIGNTDKLIRLREGILDNWDNMRNDVFKKLLPYAELRSLLKDAGCPVRPEAINLTRERVIRSAYKAHMIRKRFTVLDLAFELGIFDTVLQKMEMSDYFG